MGASTSVRSHDHFQRFQEEKFKQTDNVANASFGIVNYGYSAESILFLTPADLKAGKNASIANFAMFETDHDDSAIEMRNSAHVIEFVKSYFPGARDSKEIVAITERSLQAFGCNETNTLFAQSLCPDEINHKIGGLLDQFRGYMMGEEFCLGGLAGLPFTGTTGYAAYSHHVPEDGNLFIIFGPHIGVTESLKLGAYDRIGQTHSGAACGASVGALKYCRTCTDPTELAKEFTSDYTDYQMNYLKSEIMKRISLITNNESENDEQAALVNQVYFICKDFMDRIIDTHQKGRLIILGGIQINMPHHLPDFFQPLVFDSYVLGQPKQDLLVTAFSSSTVSASLTSGEPRPP